MIVQKHRWPIDVSLDAEQNAIVIYDGDLSVGCEGSTILVGVENVPALIYALQELTK